MKKGAKIQAADLLFSRLTVKAAENKKICRNKAKYPSLFVIKRSIRKFRGPEVIIFSFEWRKEGAWGVGRPNDQTSREEEAGKKRKGTKGEG